VRWVVLFDAETALRLKAAVSEAVDSDKRLLDELRTEARKLGSNVSQIYPRVTTAISLVSADGGDNFVRFDPFLIQLVRVVDSSRNEHCLDVLTPSTNIHVLSRRQFDDTGRPATPLGEMMATLKVKGLTQLSYMIRVENGRPTSPGWISAYRELVEWAVLLKIARSKDISRDILLVKDGLLRSNVFAGGLFNKYREELYDAIDHHRKRRRKVYVTGIAKKSKVLDRYNLAMMLEKVMNRKYPCYVRVPRDMESKAYLWPIWAGRENNAGHNHSGSTGAGKARDADSAGKSTNGDTHNNIVGGSMFFAKFGSLPADPIWPVDVLIEQEDEASVVLGYLLSDARAGFPVPYYPMCLQKAHEHAALADLDWSFVQDFIIDAIRQIAGPEDWALDTFLMQNPSFLKEQYRR
jgi:hypothetical protein